MCVFVPPFSVLFLSLLFFYILYRCFPFLVPSASLSPSFPYYTTHPSFIPFLFLASFSLSFPPSLFFAIPTPLSFRYLPPHSFPFLSQPS